MQSRTYATLSPILRLSLLLTLLLSALLTPAVVWSQAALPPALLSTSPSAGARWGGEPVVFTFDQPVEVQSLVVEPDIDGATSSEGTTVTFTPSAAPSSDARYHFTLAIAGDGGVATVVDLTVAGASPLAVTATQPNDGASEVSTDSQIVVSFNRPVVPLTGIDDQAALPQPLTIEPALEGEGSWLNTSIFVFKPRLGLAGSTEYRVTVDALTGLQGETLAAPVVFSFSTTAPIVVEAQPVNTLVRPDAVVRVSFSQAMEHASTEAAFGLMQVGGGSVDGVFAWNTANTTLTFTPTAPLDFGERYLMTVGEGAKPLSGQGQLRTAFQQDFQIVPLPAVADTTPSEGAVNVSPDIGVVIRFNAPLSRTLLMNNVQISPMLTTTTVYSYYNEYDNTLNLDWSKEPQTAYTVTLGAAIGDEYGNTFGQDYQLHFKTGDYPPFVRIDLDRFTHFTAITDTRVGVLYRNMPELKVDLYRLPVREFLSLTGENQWQLWDSYQLPDREANLVWSRVYTTTPEQNVAIRQVVRLDDGADGLLAPGIYLLEADRPVVMSADVVGGQERERAIIVISNQNMVIKKGLSGNSLVWLTDVVTAQPTSDQGVEFFFNGASIGQTQTNGDGVGMAELNLPSENSYLGLVAISGSPGDPDFAVASSDWSNGIAVWDFNINGGYRLDEYQSIFYTERPIYRPGQTVYWKGIIRRLVDDSYQLPPEGLKVDIVVRNDRGDSILERELTVSEVGTVAGEVALAPEATTGYYYLEARMQIGPNKTAYSGIGFQVASYRKPEFEIAVTPDKPEYTQGDVISVTMQASYFSGGALANAPVTWQLIADAYNFYWDGAPDDRYYSFTPFDPEQTRYDPYAGAYYGLVREGSGVTDGSGKFVITMPADLGQSLQSQRWMISLVVQSPTGQAVGGSASFPVHRGAFYIGISPQSYVNAAGSESKIDVVTITPQGEAMPGVDLEMVVYEYEWNSVYEQGADGVYRWTSSVQRTPVLTTTLRSDRAGMETLTWTPAKGGQYQIVANAVDDAGNKINSAIYTYASTDAEFVAWPRENNDRIELVADKRMYMPGDTAKVLVPSPFQGSVQALVTIERAGVREARVMTLAGNGQTLDIPITADLIPNVYLSVILGKGVDETNPTAAIRVGYVQLNVDTAAKQLTVDVSASAEVLQPGQTVTYTLSVTDKEGQPAPDTDVSVAIIDKALLSLAQGDTRSLLDIFYFQRPLEVSTGATLIINKDRVSQQLSEGAKGGGGGGGGGGLEVREDFPDTTLWRSDFVTDGEGKLIFAVKLPDNLTTWRLLARAVNAETLVGDAQSDVVVTKDLQVRPALPRFFTAGDRAKVGLVVINTTDQPVSDGLVTIAVSGATLDSAKAEFPFTLAAGANTRFDFPITVLSTADSVVVTMTAVATAQGPVTRTVSDAVRLALPVVRYETPEVVASSGEVGTDGRLEAIVVPQDATESGDLSIMLQPSLAAGMIEGLTYLEHYQYECNEQTTSRFLPNLFTVRALRSLSINDPALESKLSYQLGIGVQRLVSRQNPDGGWGYWPQEESAPYITAYVLWGLWNAQAMDFTVPESALDRAVAYLDRNFRAPDDVRNDWELNQMAFTHFVLAEMGDGDPGRASTLYDVRERLAYYGRAYLAMAINDMNPGDPRVAVLLGDLSGAATMSATGASWHEGSTDWYTFNTDTRTTAIVLGAFARLQPDNPILPNVVRWLMAGRKAGIWASTQETAWSIISLTDWMVASGELEADYDWGVTVNDNEIGSGHFDRDAITDQVQLRVAVADLLRGEANALRMSRSDAAGRLYYTTHLRYFLDALAIEPRDRGIVVDRRFDIGGKAVSSAKVGDIISVTVTIVAPTDLYHVSVSAPIPAGTEPVDASLANAPVVYDEAGNPVLTSIGAGNWWDWTPTYRDIRDDKVAFFATTLRAGTYQYTFQVRASLPGEYRVLPVYAELMYFTEVWGRSGGDLFTVTE